MNGHSAKYSPQQSIKCLRELKDVKHWLVPQNKKARTTISIIETSTIILVNLSERKVIM